MTNTIHEIELTILGHILANNKNVLECTGLESKHFENPIISQYYQTALELYKTGQTIDFLSLKLGSGLDFEDVLINAISKTTWTNINTAIDHLRSNYKNRESTKLLQQTLQDGVNHTNIENLKNNLQMIESFNTTQNLLSVSDCLGNWLEQKAATANSPTLNFPLKCFIDENITIGQGWLVTIGARAKMGKSTFALQTALEVAKTGKKVVFFSLEMSQEEIIDKSIAYLGGVSPTVVKNWASQDNISQFAQAKYQNQFKKGLEELSQLNLKLFTDNTNVWSLEQMIRREDMQGHIDLVIIDQLSFVKTDGQFRRGGKIEEYDFVVRQLKLLARELKTPIILLAQLNREVEKRGDERPLLSDLKDCGGIEETSDMILLLYRKDQKASCFVTSRHNAGGKFDLIFDSKLAKFADLNLSNI